MIKVMVLLLITWSKSLVRRRVHAVGGTDGGREGSETSAEKEKAQERKKFVKHMYNEKTLKDETGKLFGRHLRMP